MTNSFNSLGGGYLGAHRPTATSMGCHAALVTYAHSYLEHLHACYILKCLLLQITNTLFSSHTLCVSDLKVPVAPNDHFPADGRHRGSSRCATSLNLGRDNLEVRVPCALGQVMMPDGAGPEQQQFPFRSKWRLFGFVSGSRWLPLELLKMLSISTFEISENKTAVTGAGSRHTHSLTISHLTPSGYS